MSDYILSYWHFRVYRLKPLKQKELRLLLRLIRGNEGFFHNWAILRTADNCRIAQARDYISNDDYARQSSTNKKGLNL